MTSAAGQITQEVQYSSFQFHLACRRTRRARNPINRAKVTHSLCGVQIFSTWWLCQFFIIHEGECALSISRGGIYSQRLHTDAPTTTHNLSRLYSLKLVALMTMVLQILFILFSSFEKEKKQFNFYRILKEILSNF